MDVFNNIGGKLKGLAWFTVILGIVGGVSALILMTMAGSFGYGLLYGVAIVFCAWLSSLSIYGIGEAAENSALALEELRKGMTNKAGDTSGNTNAPKTTPKTSYIPDPPKAVEWVCPDCGKKNGSLNDFCLGCGAKRPK